MDWAAEDFADPEWLPTLERGGWDCFEAVWDLEHHWVDALNRRRGGWGGVSRHELPGPEGPVGVYLKVHGDQVSRSLRHPLLGRPTLARELASLRRCGVLGIGCPRPVYYAARRIDGEVRSLLATAELTGYRHLRGWMEEWAKTGVAPKTRDAVIAEVARLLRRLHRAGYKVNSFTPDHVFLRFDPAGVDARLVDLERLKRTRQPRRACVHDLATLRRTSTLARATDRLRFLRAYLELPRLSADARVL